MTAAAPFPAFELARKVADAVLYEGYLLYPYRASAAKNQARWQFGVLLPRRWSEHGPEEPWSSQTECLLEPEESTTVRVLVRFLHVQAKTVEVVDLEAGTFNEVPALPVDGSELVPWDEAAEQEVTVEAPLARLLEGELVTPFERPGGRRVEPVHTAAGKLAGRTVRRRWPVLGAVRLSAERLEGPYGLVRLRLVVENASAWHRAGADRSVALRHSLVAAHSLLGVDQGVFLSLLDPPEWAKPAAEACQNVNTWPVLIGEEGRRDAMLSSPIILYDHPTIAPESPGDLFDSTEIDEILTLRVMTMTEAEKAEARATDPRAREIIDRCDDMTPEMLQQLHGILREPRPASGPSHDQAWLDTGGVPWWDPAADESVRPEVDAVVIKGVSVRKDSRVRLRPSRRADAQDLFLADRDARVTAVLSDVDGDVHVAVVLLDDPAADLHDWYGRYLYFAPDELEPLTDPAAAG